MGYIYLLIKINASSLNSVLPQPHYLWVIIIFGKQEQFFFELDHRTEFESEFYLSANDWMPK